MSWDTKGSRGPYYYKSVREGDRVRKIYIGRGERAIEEARKVEQRKQNQQAQREARHQEITRIAAANALLKEFKALADVLILAIMTDAGFYLHRGQWRKRQGKGEPS
jgi:hypothetical protein